MNYSRVVETLKNIWKVLWKALNENLLLRKHSQIKQYSNSTNHWSETIIKGRVWSLFEYNSWWNKYVSFYLPQFIRSFT